MTERDRKRLEGCHADLIAKVGRVLDVMAEAGSPMMVVSGCRTVSEQQSLYAQGRTAPGRIVTYADGALKKSNHQSGRAADCCFVVGQQQPSWTGPWDDYGAAAEAYGLNWGGRWKKPDRPHVELRPLPEGTLVA